MVVQNMDGKKKGEECQLDEITLTPVVPPTSVRPVPKLNGGSIILRHQKYTCPVPEDVWALVDSGELTVETEITQIQPNGTQRPIAWLVILPQETSSGYYGAKWVNTAGHVFAEMCCCCPTAPTTNTSKDNKTEDHTRYLRPSTSNVIKPVDRFTSADSVATPKTPVLLARNSSPSTWGEGSVYKVGQGLMVEDAPCCGHGCAPLSLEMYKRGRGAVGSVHFYRGRWSAAIALKAFCMGAAAVDEVAVEFHGTTYLSNVEKFLILAYVQQVMGEVSATHGFPCC
eukprot:TRINITY_DN93702_c0_g1_i1.p1 TRINITY_DN93702_c0_g1~~TRINITY_DN93702_c0_g1_i1.p1  ORF type:complete len:284 (+),score=19.17 TRINITY_DN93702_c0_g1_i1:79-930(+)